MIFDISIKIIIWQVFSRNQSNLLMMLRMGYNYTEVRLNFGFLALRKPRD